MSRGFHLSTRIDETRNLILFGISGQIDSAALTDRLIAVYDKLDAPWTYDRLFDYRRADGIVDFDEIQRLARWWHAKTGGISYSGRVAVIVNNPLDQARVHIVAELFPFEMRGSFFTLDEALDWLDDARKAA